MASLVYERENCRADTVSARQILACKPAFTKFFQCVHKIDEIIMVCSTPLGKTKFRELFSFLFDGRHFEIMRFSTVLCMSIQNCFKGQAKSSPKPR